MSRIYLDITGRFDSAFGFAAKNIIGRAVKWNPYRFENYESPTDDFEDVTFKYEDVTLNFAAMPFIDKNKSAFHIPLSKPTSPDIDNIVAPPPLITFSRKKNLVITELEGKDVEVVERWNTDTYDIRMRGILVDMKNHDYPSDLVRTLHKLFGFNGIIEVSGTRFFEKDIHSIYIKEYEISGVAGYADTVQYTIVAKATSDVDTVLQDLNINLLNQPL